MSVSSIPSVNVFDFNNPSIQSRARQFQQEFQQLGKDLQSGNLSAAQADFATLQQTRPLASAASTAQSNNPIAQQFDQLGKDLQSGNILAAQQDFATIQQDLQNQAVQGRPAHHHHHHSGGGGEGGSINQQLDQLGQALQSGDLAAAQQAYGALQQDHQTSAQKNGSASAPPLPPGTQALPPSTARNISVNA